MMRSERIIKGKVVDRLNFEPVRINPYEWLDIDMQFFS